MKAIEITELKNLKEYKLSKKLSTYAWDILTTMDAENRQLLGDPFVLAIDAIGANITEGFNQINAEAKVNFYINSKAALSEAVDHWLDLMLKRNVISKITFMAIKDLEKPLQAKLNKLISASINK